MVTAADGARNSTWQPHVSTVVANTPSSKDSCKKGGWATLTDHFGTPFKSRGDCVSYVAIGGRNPGG